MLRRYPSIPNFLSFLKNQEQVVKFYEMSFWRLLSSLYGHQWF